MIAGMSDIENANDDIKSVDEWANKDEWEGIEGRGKG